MIPYNDLFNKFNEIADQLITDVNATAMTLHYAPLNPSNQSGTDTPSDIVGFYGQQQPVNFENNRENQSGENKVFNTLQENITVRAYWVGHDLQKLAKELNIDISKKICKIICFTTDANKLDQAIRSTVNGVNLKILKRPVPYGFQKRYSVSYWQEHG